MSPAFLVFCLFFISLFPSLIVSCSAQTYSAQVVRVIDGDTVHVHVYPWPGMIVETRIRLLNVDTPELRGKCAVEKAKAREAKAMVAKLLPVGTAVQIRNVKQDKYAGRHDADVILTDGRSLSEILIVSGLARSYNGGARSRWCEQ